MVWPLMGSVERVLFNLIRACLFVSSAFDFLKKLAI
jgi:hypothetical protein